MNAIILAFDVGTYGLRASLVDEHLNILRNVTTTYPTHRLPGGGMEQDSTDWWMSAVRAMLMLRELTPEYVKKVDAVTISGHMQGCLPMSGEGRALRPAIIFEDSRATSCASRLQAQFGQDFFYDITGNVLTPAATLCKALWIKENEPEIYRQTAKFLQSKDYLVYRLCGNMDSTDLSDASYGVLLDLKTKQYDPALFAGVGLDLDKFPVLHTSCELAGRLTEEAACHLGLRAGIPVGVGGADKACANVGAGVAVPGDFYLNLDTSAWIAGQMDEPFWDPQHRVFHVCSLDGNGYNVFGTVKSAGSSVAWAQELFEIATPRAFDSAAFSAPAGAEGLIYLPYLNGERSPMFDDSAKGVFFGMTPQHKREHFVRAVLEGVACGLGQVLEVLRERQPISDLRIIGGAAKSKVWKQIIADVCDVRLHDLTVFSDSANSLGAAAAVGVGIGLFESLSQATAQIPSPGVFTPNPATQQAYAAIKKRYAMLYPSLAEVFHTEL